MTYIEMLRHPMWQKKRLELLQASDYTCQNCFATEKPLHVHHMLYEKGKKPWEYPLHVYRVLCGDCHQEAQDLKTEMEHLLARFGFAQLHTVLGYIKAIAGEPDYGIDEIIADVREAEGASDYLRINPSAVGVVRSTSLVEAARAYYNPDDGSWLGYNKRRGE